MPAAAAVGAHADALDIARAQRASTVQQPPLDDRRVADQLLALPEERVDAAERVLPVVLVEVALEDVREQGPRGLERRAIELGGVGGAQLSHR